jgi:hypothetical protein
MIENGTTTTAHREYQYGYDKHRAWRGHWSQSASRRLNKGFNEAAGADQRPASSLNLWKVSGYEYENDDLHPETVANVARPLHRSDQ